MAATKPLASDVLMQDIAASLHRIADALAQREHPLGFGPSPGRKFVFVNRRQGYNWYHLGHDGSPMPITEPAISGYVCGLELSQVQRNGQEVAKLRLHLRADQHYVLESGAQTVFSKGLVSALTRLTPDDLLEPLTIEPQAAENGEVLFARVYRHGEPIYAPWEDDTDFGRLTQQAMEIVAAAQR